MHALRSYIQTTMDSRGWKPADLARATGLSIQLVGQLLNDERDVLPSIPKRSTLEGLAAGFGTNVSHVMTYVFEAMGYSLAEARSVVDLNHVRSRELLEALAARLPSDDEETSDGTTTNPDNVTPLPTREAPVTRGTRKTAARPTSSGRKKD